MARAQNQTDPAPPAESDAGTAETDRIHTLDAISDRLDKLARRVEEFFSAGGHAGKPDNPRDDHPTGDGGRPASPPATLTAAQSADERRREMREAFADLRSQERADEEHQSILKRLSGVEERTAEKPPRELRRVEQWFKWGDS